MNRNYFVIIVAIFTGISCSKHKPTLDEVVRELAGTKLVDCGTVALDSDSTKVDQCVVKSFQGQEAFVARYQVQGIDSEVATVYVGTGREVYELLYDSDPCGGSGCGPYIQRKRCVSPKIVEAQNRIHLNCT